MAVHSLKLASSLTEPYVLVEAVVKRMLFYRNLGCVFTVPIRTTLLITLVGLRGVSPGGLRVQKGDPIEVHHHHSVPAGSLIPMFKLQTAGGGDRAPTTLLFRTQRVRVCWTPARRNVTHLVALLGGHQKGMYTAPALEDHLHALTILVCRLARCSRANPHPLALEV
eukprot:Rmarinus@m.10204